MTRQMNQLVLAVVLAVPVIAVGAEAKVRIYLPRTVAVETSAITLGQVAIIHAGGADVLAAKAQAVPLGRAPQPGEKLVLDRPTIRARLATEGLKGDRVKLLGAGATAITLDARTLEADRILAAALRALPDDDLHAWSPARLVEPMVIPASGNVSLTAACDPKQDGNRRTVTVTAVVAGQPGERCDVVFQRSYHVTRAVATRDILAGEPIGPTNARLKKFRLHRKEASLTALPTGVVARQKIQAGTVLTDALLTAPLDKAAIKRNQGVVMRINGDGFVIQAAGTALEDGRVGQIIKVRNVDTFRIVQAKVMADGSVRPMVEE